MTSKIRIGLLDADSDVRFGRRMALSSQPKLEIVFDSDGLTDDLEALEQSLIDVLIIDQKLSSGPGLDFYSNLRAIAGNKQTPPAILTTAFNQPTLLLEALQIGIFDVVSLERGAAGLVESVLEANSGSPSRSLLALRQLVDSQPPARQVDLGFVRLVDDLPVKISSSIRRLKSVWLSSDSSTIEKYNLGSLNEAISALPVANPVELVLAMSRSGLLGDE